MPYRLTTRVLVLALCASAVACSRGASPISGSASLDSQADAIFAQQIRADSPGCAVGVYRNGEVVLARGYGVTSVQNGQPITPRTNFNLGSLSKPFTTFAVLLLEQQGKLSMDDDVRKWVPELPDYGTPIRVRDLLQHTTGLRDFGTLELLSGRSVETMADFLSLITAQRSLNFTPGTTHEYSHSDYDVLGLVVERAAKATFGDHLERAVFVPMGMKESRVQDGRRRSDLQERASGHDGTVQGARIREERSQTFGGGNVYSSVADLARLDANFEKPVVGGPEAIARMLSRPLLPNGESIPYAYGLRLGSYRGLRTVYRGGHPPGTSVQFTRFPDQGLTVAVLCNADNLESFRLAQNVADLYLGDKMSAAPPLAKPPAAVAISPQELAQYAGVYRSATDPWNLLPIEVRNGVLGEVLFDDAKDEVFYSMTPAGGGRFFEIGTTGNVGILGFLLPSSGGQARLEISWSDGPVEALERVSDREVWRPSASALADYAGVWFSEEIDRSWQIEVRGSRLVLLRKEPSSMTLRPVAPDKFLRGFGPGDGLLARIQFHRDAAGKVTHCTVSTPPGEDAVQGLRFARFGAK